MHAVRFRMNAVLAVVVAGLMGMTNPCRARLPIRKHLPIAWIGSKSRTRNYYSRSIG